MGFRAIEPVQITGLQSGPADFSLWNEDINLTSFTTIPAPATAVLFYIVNDSSNSWVAALRHANNSANIYSTSNFAGGRIAHFIATLEGPSGSIFDFYTQVNTSLKFFIGGFFHELTVFEPQNRISSSTSTNSWQTKTISEVPTGTTYVLNGTAINTTTPNNVWRDVGGSVEYPVHGFISFIKLNSNKQFEVNVSSSELVGIWGYTDKTWIEPVATLTGNTMANTTWSANSNWNDFPYTYPNKTGVLVFQDDGWNASYTGFLRKKGSSWSIARAGNQPPTSLIVEPDSSGVFQYWIESANPTGSLVVSTLFTETVPDYTLTDVNTTEQVSAGDSGIVFTGRGLSTVDKIRIASSNSRYISANVTSASANTVIASIPTDSELFSSNVAFGNVTFSVEVSGNVVANLSGTLSLSSQYGQHVVDSLSSANTNSIYYNQFYPIKVGDKIAYDAITKTHGWSTTVDSNGFISATASYSTQEDTISYRTYYSDFEQWSTPGTVVLQTPYINARANSVRVAKSADGKRYSKYPSGWIPPFFTDGFESGDLTRTENGAFWYTPNTGADDDVSVVTGRGNPGKSLQFTFTAEPDLALFGFAEARFSLGADYTELTIAFDLYIPSGAEGWGSAAYAHRDSTGSDNNKFFRLWPSTGDTDREEVGASLLLNSVPNGYSAIRSEWNVPEPAGSDMTERGQAKASFISAADLGTWIAVKLYCKAATATTNGTLRIYKNGTLVIDNSETVANYNAASPHSWRYGYLLGFANSGFTNTTMLQIDNVRFYAGAA